MKPSEYFKNEIPARIKWYAEEFAKTNRVYEELDSRFIDKEELKEKINLVLNNNIIMLDIDFGRTRLTYDNTKIFYKEIIKKEILKLLEE